MKTYFDIIEQWSKWAAERTEFNPIGHEGYIKFAMVEAISQIAKMQLPITINFEYPNDENPKTDPQSTTL